MPCYHPIQAHLMVLCNWGSIGKEGRGLAIGPGTRVYKTRARCVVGLRPAAKMPTPLPRVHFTRLQLVEEHHVEKAGCR